MGAIIKTSTRARCILSREVALLYFITRITLINKYNSLVVFREMSYLLMNQTSHAMLRQKNIFIENTLNIGPHINRSE